MDDQYVDCLWSLKRNCGRAMQRNQFFWITVAVC